MSKNIKMSNKVFLGIWIPSLILLMGIIVASNILANHYNTALDVYIGKGEIIKTPLEGREDWDTNYYSSSFKDSNQSKQNGEKTVQEICDEGIVLLKNNHNVLPLNKDEEVTLLGRGSVDPVYGGSGSGNVDTSTCANPKTGLENAGLKIDENTYNFFMSNYSSYDKTNIVMDKYQDSYFFIGEIPSSKYNFPIKSNNTAIVFISRAGGEGGDLSTNLLRDSNTEAAKSRIRENLNTAEEIKNYKENQHQLELSQEEKDMVSFATKNYKNVIMVINSSNVMELQELKDNDDIDSILWVGSMGSTGFNSLGNILVNRVNPSGKTPDIYPSDLTKDPTFMNSGMNGISKYKDISTKDDILPGDTAYDNGLAAYFVQYEEGIYIGYRYYETASEEGFINYNEYVTYPFGYGLSYTTFEKELISYSTDDETIIAKVKVTNTGEYPGKEVVQLYYSAPYKETIEKSSTVLGDFKKTKILDKNESEIVTLSIKKEDMASYDYRFEKAYVLDEGEYKFQIKENSHQITLDQNDKELKFSSTEDRKVYKNGRESDVAKVTNQFDDVSAIFKDEKVEGYSLNMSRKNFKETFPTMPTEKDANPNIKLDNYGTIKERLKPYKIENNSHDEMPKMSQDNGLQLIDLRGLDYNDKSWQLLLDQLTEKDYNNSMANLSNNAYLTPKIDSISKPATTEHDGPQGFSVLWGEKPNACAYMSEPLLAATFNLELAKKMGISVGEEALTLNYNGWYGPAINLHRSAFAGRNFEYYSEDPYLSGKMAEYVISGAADKGLYTFTKHFALNDQEYKRTVNLCTWANEQTIREIYLRPFEMAIKNAKTTMKYISDERGTLSNKEIKASTALMSSFNRIGTTWAGGSVPLMDNVLRGEWGFEGCVISDFNLYDYMVSDQGIRAGTDMQLTFNKPINDTTAATARIALRKSYHNVLYTIVNSNAMQHIAPGTLITYTLSPWRIALICLTTILSLFLIAGATWVVIRVRKHNLEPSE